MKKLMIILALRAGSVFFAGSMVAAADQVCPDLDTGKISANQQTVKITAPDGYLIDSYCVKAGSANQGDGPVIVDVNPPVKSLTISYPGGKDISHYSVSYVREGTTTDTPKTPQGETPKGETPKGETPTTGGTSNEVASLPSSGA